VVTIGTGVVKTTFGNGLRDAGGAETALASSGWRRIANDVDAMASRVLRDVAIAHASGRWRPGRPDPASYVPGDVVALRAFSVTSDFGAFERYRAILGDPRTGREAQMEAALRTLLLLEDLQILYEAAPHFLEATVAGGILASRPPGMDVLGELRLPYPRIAVFLGRVFELPPELCAWPREWDRARDPGCQDNGWRTTLGDLRALGGGIEGVVLAEAPGGGLSDEVLWLVSTNPDPTLPSVVRQDRLRALMWGRLSSSHLAHVATNLAAAVCWGEWHEARRLDLPEGPGSRSWRKAVRRGEFRRHEPHGGAAGVRVLDLGRSPVIARTTPLGPPDSPTRATPVTHLRRAHWRLQPVGPGRSQRRVVRVQATVVNPGSTPLSPVVYRIPPPEESPSAPDPEVHPGITEPAVIDLRHIDLSSPAPDRAPTRHRSGPEVEW
jgi:hypothetical protein